MLQGIVAKVDKVFQKDAFFVLQINIQEVDTMKIVEMKGGKDGAKKATQLDYILSSLGAKTMVDDNLLALAVCKIQDILPKRMSERMAAKGIVVDIDVKVAAQEALFFFETISSSDDGQ